MKKEGNEIWLRSDISVQKVSKDTQVSLCLEVRIYKLISHFL